MAKRRDVLIGVGGIVALAGCTEPGSSPEIEDETISAEVGEVIVTLDDLESGWSDGGGGDSEGEAVFLTDEVTVEISITRHSSVSEAEGVFDDLRAEQTEGTSSDSVEYGNEGFTTNPFDDYVFLGFRAANFVVEIESYTEEFALTDPEDTARDFADIIIEKIVNAQSD